MAQANVKLTVDSSQATRALKGVQSQTQKLNNGVNRLKTAVAGIGFTVLARQAIITSANFEKLNVRLGLLTKASGTFARSQEIAAEAQKLFGLSATEALEGITNITARLQPLGVGVEDIRTTFIGFNTAAKLAGASAMESSAAFRQLAQALGSGRLQGDEFRSIAEQVPTILAPIAAELNTTVGGLKKFASEGKLTSDVVIRALKKVELDGAASLKALLENDPTQVFKNLGNEAENLKRAFGDLLAPAVLPVIRVITDLTKAVTEFLNSPLGTTAAIFAAIAVAAKGVAVALPLVALGLQKVAFAGGVATLALNAIPFVAVASGIGAVVTQLIKQKREQDKVTEAIKKGELAQLRALEADLGIKMAKEIATINDSNDRKTINAAERRLALLQKQMKPIKERLDTVIQENAVTEKNNKNLEKANELLEKKQEAAKKLKEKFDEIGQSVEQNLVQNLADAVEGAQSLGSALSNVLKNLRRQLIELAITQAVGGIGGIVGDFLNNIFNPQPKAMGGSVSAGGSFLVGEKGPELFVPQKSGTIVPNHALGGSTNVVVNVDASGSAVQGDDDNATKLGELIAAAVQAEIVTQQMSGGLLS